MADSSSVQIQAHEQTYASFTKLLKYGALACFLIAAIVVVVIAS